MSINNLGKTNVRVITLGEMTTGISQILVGENTESSGILFSNTLDGTMSDNAVILQIIDIKGVFAYTKAIIDLLKTWNINNDLNKVLNKLDNELAKELNK